ncbi:uncharacterized protein BXZ73DRAFT_102052 [Epithele typhae]|uniref:uncharacterized protein n=1 Tax=Epithele typhae TaxID=378194 RepID=UPI002007F0E3|nr:uncharacterized protein BXZ73DRAFT_102052 [Epithele typhae]KAH9929522.1 hypothetical protein BXZ73DRAFT_102052 [Epithele typhae]
MTRMCLIDPKRLLNIVGGEAPSADQRQSFLEGNLTGPEGKPMQKEKDMYPVVNEVIRSVLLAAHSPPAASTSNSTSFTSNSTASALEPISLASSRPPIPDPAPPSSSSSSAATPLSLRVLTTPTQNESSENRHATRCDLGIYLSEERSKKATKLDKIDEDRCSWHHQLIPIEVKLKYERSAFYSKEGSATEDEPVSDSVAGTEGSGAQSTEADSTFTLAESSSSHAGTPNSPAVQMAIPTTVPPFIRNSKEGMPHLAQLLEYMLNIFNYQHRLFAYMIYIVHDVARILYFDRVGVLVTRPFQWLNKDSHLHDFIWRIARSGDLAALGLDPTATFASDDDEKQFRDLATGATASLKSLIVQATKADYPVYKLVVTPAGHCSDTMPYCDTDQPASNLEDPRQFLVGAPMSTSNDITGRATKTHLAQDVKTGRLVIVKTSWRPLVPGRTRPEHSVYLHLHGLEDENISSGIPTLVCGGDVGGSLAQKTIVQDYLRTAHSDGGDWVPAPRVHYRIVLEEVLLPLTDFTSFNELSVVMANTIMTHWFAYSTGQVLHRDISVANIMIHPETRRGYLIDFDLCLFVCELEKGKVEPDRTGTWYFRSALSLLYPFKPYRFSDDLESFVHAYRYLVYRYHPVEEDSLIATVKDIYEVSKLVDGISVGGRRKMKGHQMPKGEPRPDDVGDDGLKNLLKALAKGCYESYRVIDEARMKAAYGIKSSPAGNKQSNTALTQKTVKPSRLMSLDATKAQIHEDSQLTAPPHPSPTEPLPASGSRSTTTDPSSTAVDTNPASSDDPSIVTGFLASPEQLVEVLLLHGGTTDLESQKSDDQFKLALKQREKDSLRSLRVNLDHAVLVPGKRLTPKGSRAGSGAPSPLARDVPQDDAVGQSSTPKDSRKRKGERSSRVPRPRTPGAADTQALTAATSPTSPPDSPDSKRPKL